MSIERIETLNSVYEIDYDNMRVRRVSGVNDPTPNFGEDGAWRDLALTFTQPNGAMTFLFEDGGATTTSKVVKR